MAPKISPSMCTTLESLGNRLRNLDLKHDVLEHATNVLQTSIKELRTVVDRQEEFKQELTTTTERLDLREQQLRDSDGAVDKLKQELTTTTTNASAALTRPSRRRRSRASISGFGGRSSGGPGVEI